MEKAENKRYKFGLIGKNISYSFSQGYFTKKFQQLGLKSYTYENFDLQHIGEFPKFLNSPLSGANVTIPYKEVIMPYLSAIDPKARKIGAVNTIKFTPEGTIGYNTDVYGFKTSLLPLLKAHHTHALILGTGGASKAIAYVFGELGIAHTFVSRNPQKGQLNYSDLEQKTLDKHSIIVNCTPLGTSPDIYRKPDLPYSHIGSKHLLYDLIYNPSETAFLKEGASRDAIIQNGLPMLELQAEKAWEIWNM